MMMRLKDMFLDMQYYEKSTCKISIEDILKKEHKNGNIAHFHAEITLFPIQ